MKTSFWRSIIIQALFQILLFEDLFHFGTNHSKAIVLPTLTDDQTPLWTFEVKFLINCDEEDDNLPVTL